jgi:putative flippase GtrA
MNHAENHRDADMKRIVFFERTTNPFGQFLRYLIAGGISAAIELVLFALLSWRIFPALREDEWAVRLFDLTISPVDPAQRALNFAACMTITFVVVNWMGYVLNARWVFIPGRHSRKKEILLFYSIALLSYLAGTLLGSSLIALFETTGTTAYVAMTAASVLINYSFRKFLIFKG